MSQWSWRTWLLLLALVATVLLIITDDTQVEESGIADGVSGQRNRPASVKSNEKPLEDLRLDYLVRENAKVETTNAFSPSTWYRAPPPRRKLPPPPPAPYVAPAPTAPPLPFKYFGSYEDGPKRIVLLLKGGQIYPVIEGDTIDNIYRVQKIVGSKIEMVYLPLGVTQTINTGINAFSAR